MIADGGAHASLWPAEALRVFAPGTARMAADPIVADGVDPDAPRRWLLRRLGLGRVLELACGAGHRLLELPRAGVGVDPDPAAVALARAIGGVAYTPDEFARSPDCVPGGFDALLLSDVVHRLSLDAAFALVSRHLPQLTESGRVVILAPQEAAHHADPAAVAFSDFDRLDELAGRLSLRAERRESYPHPRAAGPWLASNRFVAVYARGAAPGHA